MTENSLWLLLLIVGIVGVVGVTVEVCLRRNDRRGADKLDPQVKIDGIKVPARSEDPVKRRTPSARPQQVPEAPVDRLPDP